MKTKNKQAIEMWNLFKNCGFESGSCSGDDWDSFDEDVQGHWIELTEKVSEIFKE